MLRTRAIARSILQSVYNDFWVSAIFGRCPRHTLRTCLRHCCHSRTEPTFNYLLLLRSVPFRSLQQHSQGTHPQVRSCYIARSIYLFPPCTLVFSGTNAFGCYTSREDTHMPYIIPLSVWRATRWRFRGTRPIFVQTALRGREGRKEDTRYCLLGKLDEFIFILWRVRSL